MTHGLSPIALIPLVSAGVVGVLAWSVWRQASARLRWLLACIGSWSVLYAAEIALPTVGAKIWAAKLAYLPIGLTPLATLLVAREVAGRPETRWWWGLPSLAMAPLAVTNEFHGWVWRSVEVSTGPVPALVVTHGPAFIAFNLCAQAMIGFALWSAGRVLWSERGERRSQGIWVAAGLVAPWIANLAYVMGVLGIPGLDPTPMAFGVTAYALSQGLLRPGPLRGLIDSIRNEIVEQLSDAVFVATEDGRTLYANQAARALIGTAAGASSGDLIAAVAAHPVLAQTLSGLRASELVLDVDGRPRHFDPRVSLIAASPEPVRRIVALRDVTHERRNQERVTELAYYDTLTGLPNRGRFLELLESATARAQRRGDDAALLFIDVDRFKHVNDSFGHEAGDWLLCEIARRISRVVRFNDPMGRPEPDSGESAVSRLGGDEFTVILPDIADPSDVANVAERCIRAIAEPFERGAHQFHVSASIGVTLTPLDGVDSAALLRQADLAMYEAKRRGGSSCAFFSSEMDTQVRWRAETEARLRRALEDGELELALQPIRSVIDATTMGAEVLLRWRRDGEWVLPGDFIPLAEEVGLVHQIGDWVLDAALGQIRRWQEAGLRPPRLSINVSGLQLIRPGFPERVAELLDAHGVSVDAIGLELTETALQIDEAPAREALTKLEQMGLRLVLDDFGTGTSSLAHLQLDQFCAVKIDRSFLHEVPESRRSRSLVRAVVTMSHALGMFVVAEGIEREEQLGFLRDIGCDLAQGFLFAKPMPIAAFERTLERDKDD